MQKICSFFILLGFIANQLQCMEIQNQNFIHNPYYELTRMYQTPALITGLYANNDFLVSGNDRYEIECRAINTGVTVRTFRENNMDTGVGAEHFIIMKDWIISAHNKMQRATNIYNNKIYVINKQDTGISCLQSSDIDNCFFSGGAEGILKLWDIKQKRYVRTFETQNNTITSIAQVNDRTVVMTAGSILTIADIESGKTIGTLKNDTIIECLTAVAGYLYWLDDKGKLQRWNSSNKTMEIAQETVSTKRPFAMTHTENQIVIGDCDGNIKLWDTFSGEYVDSLVHFKKQINGLACSGNIIFASSGPEITYWQPKPPAIMFDEEYEGNSEPENQLENSTDVFSYQDDQ